MNISNLNNLINGNKLSLEEINKLLPCEIVPKELKKTKSQITELRFKLSSRENEIATLISKGLKNKEISECLNITYETVKTHRKNIFRKLNINNVSQLIKIFIIL